MDIFSLVFMQRAFLAALLSGLMSPAVGTYIVQRRLSLLGDGLGHVAIAGVGLALMTNWAPTPVAIVVCVVGAVIIELLRQSGRASADVGLAILFYGGLAAGVLMAGISGRGTGVLSQYLFGSLITIGSSDVMVVAVMAIFVVAVAIGLSPQLFAVCADEDFARVQGLRVRILDLLIVVIAAATVAVSMRTVGLLLVSALMVVPVATANHLTRGFKTSLFVSMSIGAVIAVAGVACSYYWNTASGATIVVLAIAVFIISWPAASWLRRAHGGQGTAEPASKPEATELTPHIPAEEHKSMTQAAHHLAILHGDHVDYLHDGHRHAPHRDHFDEH